MLVFNTRLGVWVLFGGHAGSKNTDNLQHLNDTWVYSPRLNTWIEVKAEALPANRGLTGIWYDRPRDLVVL